VRSIGGGRAEAGYAFVVVMPWTQLGSNGEYHRRRTAGQCSHLDRGFPLEWLKKQTCAPTARRRRYSPFDPHGVCGMTTTKGFRASTRPSPKLRTPMFARHSRRFTTQNRASGSFEGRNFWRPRASGPPRMFLSHRRANVPSRIHRLVYSTYVRVSCASFESPAPRCAHRAAYCVAPAE